MKKLIWNYTMALAKPVEVRYTNGRAPWMRLAYRFGIGDKAVTNVARIKAQRELFAQLAK